MKPLKAFDVIGQLLLSIILLLLYQPHAQGFFYWLFALGGWQVLSCLLHLVNRKIHGGQLSSGRRTYEWMLLAVVLVGWILFPLMLIVGPFMALWYWITCLKETFFTETPNHIEFDSI